VSLLFAKAIKELQAMSNDNEITPSRPAYKRVGTAELDAKIATLGRIVLETFARIEDLNEGASAPIRHKIKEKIEEFSPTINSCFAQRDWVNVQVLLVVLIKLVINVHPQPSVRDILENRDILEKYINNLVFPF
jgi:hypothetical protein